MDIIILLKYVRKFIFKREPIFAEVFENNCCLKICIFFNNIATSLACDMNFKHTI